MKINRLFLFLAALLVMLSVSSCAGPKKGFDYHAMVKRNKHYGNYQKHRFKKTKGDLTRTKCANRWFHPH